MNYFDLIMNHKPVEVSFDLELLEPFLPYRICGAEFIKQEKVKIFVYFDEGKDWIEKVFVVEFLKRPVMICHTIHDQIILEKSDCHIFNVNLYQEMLKHVRDCISLDNSIVDEFIKQDLNDDIEGLHTFFRK
jgi:hypothetical protein